MVNCGKRSIEHYPLPDTEIFNLPSAKGRFNRKGGGLKQCIIMQYNVT